MFEIDQNGILITEHCSANICNNTISTNIKANIAFGGKGSQNTVIIENVIVNSAK